jgi:6-phosphogluconolactonase (cycloisomerase 2 family)
VTVSPDGKFAYAASWRPATVTGFARDPGSGKLEHKQTISDADALGGTTSIALSTDGKLAVATAFQSRTVVLFQRNAETGQLVIADVARDGVREVRLGFPIRALFSPDGKFVYAIDDHTPDSAGAEEGKGAVVAFRVNDGKLELVGIDEGKEGCYNGARGVTFHPDGRTLYVSCSRPGTLVVADRDEATGKTAVRQVLKDEQGDVHGLGGAMGVAVSPDGRFVYVSAGRFQGDDAVSAYRVGSDGRLAVVQEVVNGEGGLRHFEGGNQIALSPDGLNVYAAGTRSRTVASFRRDPDTGKLRPLETLPDGGEGGEFGAAGVCVSPDGKFVYVATEDGRSLAVFRRDTSK